MEGECIFKLCIQGLACSKGSATVSYYCCHCLFLLLQMDDEDTLLPRKLQAALEQALERKNELISQDSDSDSDDGA